MLLLKNDIIKLTIFYVTTTVHSDQPEAPDCERALIQAAFDLLEDPSVKPATIRDYHIRYLGV